MYKRQIVTHLPGTTRDLLRREIVLDGLPLHVIDTAGLRTDAGLVEEEGIRRARREMNRADRVLLVVDAGAGQAPAETLPAGVPVTLVRNKIDLLDESPGIAEADGRTVVSLSALTGAGVDALRTYLKDCAGFEPDRPGALSARRRHLDALARARQHLETGWRQLTAAAAGELLAEELRLAQAALGETTGAVSSEQLLGEIFSRFCIGK